MDAEVEFHYKYSEYLTDLKTLSFDNRNDEYLCQNTTHKYYDFDKIVKNRNYDLTPASPDTLIFKDNKVYCVEFKNSFKKNIKAPIIKKKLKNGHEVLSEIFTELGLQIEEYQLIFCVVHKGFDDSRAEKQNRKWRNIHYRIKDKLLIQFGLKQYKGKYFDDIITNNVDFFRDQFIEKIDKELPC